MKQKLTACQMGDGPTHNRDWVERFSDRWIMLRHPNGMEMRVQVEGEGFSLLFMTKPISAINVTPVSGNVITVTGREWE